MVTVVVEDPMAAIFGLTLVTAGMGLARTLKVAAAEVLPFAILLTTVTGSVAIAESMEAGTVAVMEVVDPLNLVVSSVASSTATEAVEKPDPKMRSVVSVEFTYTELGLSELMVGGAVAITLKDIDADAPPPGVGLTTSTFAVDTEAMSAAVMLAVKLL